MCTQHEMMVTSNTSAVNRSHDAISERIASWVKIGKLELRHVIALQAPDVKHPHSAFDRYRESYPRRSELHQSY